MYFHTDDPRVIAVISNAMTIAQTRGHRLRINVSPNGDLRMKVDGGMWSAPIKSTQDPFRDTH